MISVGQGTPALPALSKSPASSSTTRSLRGSNRLRLHESGMQSSRASVQRRAPPISPLPKAFKGLPWTQKDFDVRAWQQQEKDCMESPCAQISPRIRQILDGHSTGEIPPGCPQNAKVIVRKGRFGAKRDAKKRHFVEGWMTQMGLNCVVNRDMVSILSRRVEKRVRDLGLIEHLETPLVAYDEVLRAFPGEWLLLSKMARVHYTNFNRDKCFDQIYNLVMPQRIAEAATTTRHAVDVWCAGCSTGEEPYSMALHWLYGSREANMRVAEEALDKILSARRAEEAELEKASPGVKQPYRTWPDDIAIQNVKLRIIATDASEECVEKGRRGLYDAKPWSSLGRLPQCIRHQGLVSNTNDRWEGEQVQISKEAQALVTFEAQDLKSQAPEGIFDVILCRNCAFMYFDEQCQANAIQTFADKLLPGGFLVIGTNDRSVHAHQIGQDLFTKVEAGNVRIFQKRERV